MDDFRWYVLRGGKWVEDNAFEFLLNSNIECSFKFVADREMKDIVIEVKTDIPFDVAISDNLNTVSRIFTTEDKYTIGHLKKGDEKFFVVRLTPDKTGDYAVNFVFDYKVK